MRQKKLKQTELKTAVTHVKLVKTERQRKITQKQKEARNDSLHNKKKTKIATTKKNKQKKTKTAKPYNGKTWRQADLKEEEQKYKIRK